MSLRASSERLRHLHASFGSAADGRFMEGSDIDLVLVSANLESLQQGRKLIRARSSGALFKMDGMEVLSVRAREATPSLPPVEV